MNNYEYICIYVIEDNYTLVIFCDVNIIYNIMFFSK